MQQKMSSLSCLPAFGRVSAAYNEGRHPLIFCQLPAIQQRGVRTRWRQRLG